MEWQRCGGFARGLQAKGVKSIVVGDLTEEWYLYSIAHPINSPADILPNLERYFPNDVAQKFVKAFPQLPENASAEESTRLYGDIMSCGQVHLPARLLAKDLETQGFPILRYEIRWTPEQYRPFGEIIPRFCSWHIDMYTKAMLPMDAIAYYGPFASRVWSPTRWPLPEHG